MESKQKMCSVSKIALTFNAHFSRKPTQTVHKNQY